MQAFYQSNFTTCLVGNFLRGQTVGPNSKLNHCLCETLPLDLHKWWCEDDKLVSAAIFFRLYDFCFHLLTDDLVERKVEIQHRKNMSLRIMWSFRQGLVVNRRKFEVVRTKLMEKPFLQQWKNLSENNCQSKSISSLSSFKNGRVISTGSLNYLCPWCHSHKRVISPIIYATNTVVRLQSTNSSNMKAPHEAVKAAKTSKPARPRTKKPSALVPKFEVS